MLQRGLFGASGLVTLAGLALALSNEPQARADDKDQVCFHLNNTIYELRQAKEDVRNLKGLPDADRDKLLGANDSAISEMSKCVMDVTGEKPKYIAPDKDPNPEEKDWKHLRNCLREIKEAKKELRTVKGITDDHRDAALASMDKCTELLKDALDKYGK
jgi:hypothetical protein